MGFYPFGQGPAYLLPSGDQSGATDAGAINSLLAAGKPVFLVPGDTYFINQPLIPVNKSFITGFQWYAASQNDNYGAGVGQPGGALIQASASFSGPAMISMVNNSSTTQLYGVDISGICLFGPSTIPAATYGMQVVGAWGACFLRGVEIHKSGSDCLHFDVGATKVPDDWLVSECKFSASRNGHGVGIPNNLPDSTFVACESSQNALDGWNVHFCDNTRWDSCKGENNKNAGWHFTGTGADHLAMLSNCSSQFNQQDGWLFDQSGGGSAQGEYILTGCRSRVDNQAASTFASFRSNGSKSRIVGTGCYGSGAAYGAYEGGTSFGMCFTGSYFAGSTAAAFDDGTNTHALVNQSPVPF